jgi:hypothetical protein
MHVFGSLSVTPAPDFANNPKTPGEPTPGSPQD